MLSMEPLDGDDNSEGKICPKCGYVRKSTDTAPSWQCPSCGVAYAKAAAHATQQTTSSYTASIAQETAPRSRRWASSAVITAALAVLYVTWFAWHKFTASPPPPACLQSPTHAGIIMYTTTTCPYCQKARALFNRYGAPYYEYDLDRSRQAYSCYVALQGNGVPLIFIGKQRISGYNSYQLTHVLRKMGYKPVH